MANTYYDSTLTAAKIDSALKAIDGVIAPANNGKVLVIENGKIAPKPVTDYIDLNLQAKTVTPGASQQVVSPDSGYNGLSAVTVNGDADLVAGNIKKDVNIFGVTGSYEGGAPTLQSKTVTPGASQQTVQPDSGYDGLSSVVVNGDADLVAGNIKKDVEIFGVTGSYEGSGGSTLITKSITQNGTYNASSDNADGYSQVVVNVSGGGGSSGVYVGTTSPDSSLGNNGDYYYLREGRLIYSQGCVESTTTTTNQSQAGYEFTANENCYVVGLFGKLRNAGVANLYLCDINGRILAEIDGVNMTGDWVYAQLQNPVAIESGTNYICLIKRVSGEQIQYTQGTHSTDSRITYVRGRYGTSFPGSQESGSRYSADVALASNLYEIYYVMSQYYKESGTWEQIA